jgi:hypothetical protein
MTANKAIGIATSPSFFIVRSFPFAGKPSRVSLSNDDAVQDDEWSIQRE